MSGLVCECSCRGSRAGLVCRLALCLLLFHFVGCSDSSVKLDAAQRLAVKAKMAADEAAINPHTIGKMLRKGFSIPAILSTITQQHGVGACCQAALAVGGKDGAKQLQDMLRSDPGEYSSGNNNDVESTARLLATRAGECCRGSLCTGLRSAEQCSWMGQCRWKPLNVPVQVDVPDGAHVSEGKVLGVCKERVSAKLLSDTAQRGSAPVKGETSLERTRDYMRQQLKNKEAELKKDDLKLAQEEEELAAEGEITRLTEEARSLFKDGKYSEAKLYLEEAVRLDKSSVVTNIPGTSNKPQDRHGLLDLQTAASILDALRTGNDVGAGKAEAHGAQVLSGIGGPVTYGASIAPSQDGSRLYTYKTIFRLVGVLIVCFIAYITLGFKHSWRGSRVDLMTIELEETSRSAVSGGYTALGEQGLSEGGVGATRFS